MPRIKMTVNEFLVWGESQPGRHELVNGRVCAMAPERARHAECKGAVFTALRHAVRQAGIACRVLPDGMTVRIDAATAFEPDALVYCGARLPGDAVEVPEPMIVVEVLSPSTRTYDSSAKLIGYFAVPSIRHYLVVDPDRRVVVHHQRDGEAIATRILGSGSITLDPPGIAVTVEDMLDDPNHLS